MKKRENEKAAEVEESQTKEHSTDSDLSDDENSVEEESSNDVNSIEYSENEEDKYDKGLEKTRSSFMDKINRLFANFRSVDEEFFEDLEDTLIESDVGFDMAVKLTDELRDEVKLQNAKDSEAVKNVIIKKND